ncbi:uncharacterized protein PgNI_02377 [Pyricularia grisea]|uniref:Uncharacterized protein n=1 Tax=Pyricularia grisea TaxID=148305 RepID=A0A6P8BIM6_PYRGI|nr:uncharacterized protein PgNI_02377 [Pyricularia grisea]TLD16736.1 hypothetical protein PgNI_02377 [Pyricularia grisea]
MLGLRANGLYQIRLGDSAPMKWYIDLIARHDTIGFNLVSIHIRVRQPVEEQHTIRAFSPSLTTRCAQRVKKPHLGPGLPAVLLSHHLRRRRNVRRRVDEAAAYADLDLGANEAGELLVPIGLVLALFFIARVFVAGAGGSALPQVSRGRVVWRFLHRELQVRRDGRVGALGPTGRRGHGEAAGFLDSWTKHVEKLAGKELAWGVKYTSIISP